MLKDLETYAFNTVARHNHTFNIPLIADIQHVILDLAATIVDESENGNTGDIIDYIELRGNGTDPIMEFDGEDLMEFHEMYNHSIARNEAMDDGVETVARFCIPIPQHRKRWLTMTLFVQFMAITEVAASATALAGTLTPAIRYGPIPYSARVKRMTTTADPAVFNLPSDQGLAVGVVLLNTDNDEMDEISLLDRKGQEILRTTFGRARGEMQHWIEQTDAAGNWVYIPIPATATSKDVVVNVDQTDNTIRCYAIYRAGEVLLAAPATTEEAERAQRNPAIEAFHEYTKYDEQLSEATSPSNVTGGTVITPG